MPTDVEFFSQPATRQDQWVLSQHDGPGYFIEIGAHDGVWHSNTLTLERFFNWTGLLVEPNPRLFNVLKRNRPKCAHSSACIGPHDDEQRSFVIGDAGGPDAFSGLVEHMSNEWYEGHARHKSKIEYMDTISLRSLLDSYPCPQVIDYLSLDVEGAELAILQSFFARPRLHRPDDRQIHLMTVEFRYDRLLLDMLEKLLEPEYRLAEVRAFDACFVHKSLGDSHACAA
jgi:FkbM family methyltransferase